jgi:hypothetical protein
MSEVSWKKPVSGYWTIAADRSRGNVPGSGGDVTIAAIDAYTVSPTTPITARSIAIGRSVPSSTSPIPAASKRSPGISPKATTAESLVNTSGSTNVFQDGRGMNGKASQRLIVGPFRRLPKCVFAIASSMIVGCFIWSGVGRCATAPIQLLPKQLSQIQTEGMPSKLQAVLARMPPNYQHFGVAEGGKPTEPQALTLKFTATTTIIGISLTPDFEVLPGGTCQVGRRYASASVCRLIVQFTPQGAGPRLGKVILATAAGQAVSFGLLGYSYFPVVSFTPSVITTVSATISGGAGLINGAQNLGIDNGDELYIPDTGNKAVRYIDSSGIMRTIASPSAGPWGVVVDLFGEVWFSLPSSNEISEIYDYGPVVQANGTGTDACTLGGSACVLSGEKVNSPGSMATSDGNSIFFAEGTDGAALSVTHPEPTTLLRLDDPFSYQEIPTGAFSVDSNENLYTSWTTPGICAIVAQPFYYAENLLRYFSRVAGGRTCGFSGDGGQSNGAEIGKQIGQIAFDLAGNMYFSDTANNRVRRVDTAGIIRTIAGNGGTGRKGDGGPAIAAAVGTPTGVTIDSQGQIYVLASDAAGTNQVVRKVTTRGALSFGSQAQGAASAPQILNVANTGNSALTFYGHTITGADHGDFAIDPNTTNCNFRAGNFLNAGQSCQIGVVFKPAAAGARSALLNLVDNTINAENSVTLTGKAKSAPRK